MSINDGLIKDNTNSRKVMSRIALKIDTWANWNTVGKDVVLHAGEVAFVQVGTVPPMPNGDTTYDSVNSVLFKVGDGKTTFEKLPWASAKAADVYDWAKKDADAFRAWLSAESATGKKDGFATDTEVEAIRSALAQSITEVSNEVKSLVIPSIEGLATEDYVNQKDQEVTNALKGTSTRAEGVASTIAGASDQAFAAQTTANNALAAAGNANDWITANKTSLEKVSGDPITATQVGERDTAVKNELLGSSTGEGVVSTITGASAQAIAAHTAANGAQTTATEALGKANTLIGGESDKNKSVRTIAGEELAAQLIPSTAKEALDTLQEIAAWIQEHPDDAAKFNTLLSGLGTAADGKAKTVKEYVDEAVAAEVTKRDTAITTAIGKLDATKVDVGASKTLTSIEEKDGVITTSAVDIEITRSQVSDFDEHNHDDEYADKTDFDNHLSGYNTHVGKAITTDTYLLIDCGTSTDNVK